MIAAHSLSGWRRMSHQARRFAVHSVLSVATLTACGDRSALEPGSHVASAVGANAAVVVTTNHSTFDTRAEFNAVGTVDHLATFEEFTDSLVYTQDSPWLTNGVLYTSALNIVLGPGIGLGVASNSVSTEFGAPLTAQLAGDDAFTTFGADLALIGEKVPVGILLTTNLGSYAFNNLDIPLATTGRLFFGIALSKPGEHLTGFRFTVPNAGATVLLDDVAVGHVSLVRNIDPEASVGGPYAGKEGSSVTLALTATDTDADPLTYAWDLGDGTVGTGTPPASHTYADNGSYDIVLAVADGRGGVDTARTKATIANAAPVVAAFSVPSSASPLSSGGVTIKVSTTFTDAGTLDTHTATLDCGTGTPSAVSAPNGLVSGTCSYSAAGVYTVRVTVTDDDGGSDTKIGSGRVMIYDPSRWVTGGGWVLSPAGSCSSNPLAGGKLSFSLAARYEPGASLPSGSLDVKMSTSRFEFSATSFESLIIAGGSFRMQGRGKVNGAGDYAFSVAGEDGASQDAIRIRIWARSSGATVYDNQVGLTIQSTSLTPLGGGSLQVH